MGGRSIRGGARVTNRGQAGIVRPDGGRGETGVGTVDSGWPRAAYAPRGGWPVACVAAAGALVAVAAGLDRPGRLLVAGAVAVLVALAGRDVVQRPVLEAAPDGLLLWSGFRRTLVTWTDVVGVRLGQERHWSSRGPLLELDLRGPVGQERLVVLPARRLGADPAQVVALLSDLRGPDPRRS